MSAGSGVDDAQTLGGGAGPRARGRAGEGESRGHGRRGHGKEQRLIFLTSGTKYIDMIHKLMVIKNLIIVC
jgi:hypothetical protein